MYIVYMLKCADGKSYVGYTANLDQRMEAHRRGQVHFTKSRLPFELITHIVFTEKQKAYDFERYLKSGSGAAFFKKRLV
jgi:putative endonuclease